MEFVERLQLNIPVTFVVKTTPSSMHSLFALAPHLSDSQFLLSTVDSIFHEEDLKHYLVYARAHQSVDGILAVTNFIDDESPLYVHFKEGSRIGAFSKSERSAWITGGLYVLTPRIFDEEGNVIASGTQRLRNFLSYLMENGYVLEGYPFGKMVDVDVRKDISAAEELLKTK
jgi:NDP-sugar pyrophosphorylase family protein